MSVLKTPSSAPPPRTCLKRPTKEKDITDFTTGRASRGLDATATPIALIAAGGVDLVVEVGLKPYDIQALIPIVTGAGGVVSNWRGEPADQGGDIIAAATPALHREVLDLLLPLAKPQQA